MASNLAKLGKILPKNSALFLCDMQEKFRPSIKFFDQIVQNSNRLLRAATILKLPIVVTEQYPKGLGRTVAELGIDQVEGLVPIEKTKFSMCLEPVLEQLKKTPDVNSILLCGIEAHVCVQQTAIDLKSKGYEVFVIADACSSRGHAERMLGLSLLKQAGCWLTSTESAILSLAGGSDHPQFKEIQAIIKAEAPDAGIANLVSLNRL